MNTGVFPVGIPSGGCNTVRTVKLVYTLVRYILSAVLDGTHSTTLVTDGEENDSMAFVNAVPEKNGPGKILWTWEVNNKTNAVYT